MKEDIKILKEDNKKMKDDNKIIKQKTKNYLPYITKIINQRNYRSINLGD